MSYPLFRACRRYDRLKRLFDLAGAAIGLVILAPVLLGTGLAVRVALGSPILFRQERPGRGGRVFRMYKFRTMLDARGPGGSTVADEERLTPFGRFLRSTSLDELPELFNVLKGDMSLVGPRPLLVEYLPLYTPEQARRHDVRPGMTGWAQVNGRNSAAWEERFAMDVWYVDHRSFTLDLRILLLTVVRTVRREGINASDGGVMPPFRGGAPGHSSPST